jgi:hypothetical protein
MTGRLRPVYLRMNGGRRPSAAQEVSRPAAEPARTPEKKVPDITIFDPIHDPIILFDPENLGC